MSNIQLFQLAGVIFIGLGMMGLGALAYTSGAPLSREENHRLGKRGNTYRLPINLETLLAAALLLGGLGLLNWTKFELCAFLGYWIPNLPEALRMMLNCR